MKKLIQNPLGFCLRICIKDSKRSKRRLRDIEISRQFAIMKFRWWNKFMKEICIFIQKFEDIETYCETMYGLDVFLNQNLPFEEANLGQMCLVVVAMLHNYTFILKFPRRFWFLNLTIWIFYSKFGSCHGVKRSSRESKFGHTYTVNFIFFVVGNRKKNKIRRGATDLKIPPLCRRVSQQQGKTSKYCRRNFSVKNTYFGWRVLQAELLSCFQHQIFFQMICWASPYMQMLWSFIFSGFPTKKNNPIWNND